MNPLTILDCTLRDGGFYTAWDFSDDLAAEYLQAMDASGVRYAEIGYRSLKRSGFAGAYRYCSEALIERLPALTRTGLAVMLDAKELVGQEGMIGRLFRPADRSRLELVRVATKASDMASAVEQVARLHDLGYRTTLNLMAFTTVADVERDDLLVAMASSKVDVVYVADSYGSMIPVDISDIADRYDRLATKPWGVHLHNNQELAFANALAAMGRGATWVDTSVLGMGRGPGNLKTEILLQHLETRLGLEGYATEPVYDLIGRRMGAMQDQHRWGPSPAYVLSGNLSVHPTFAQALIATGRYTHHEVAAILETLHASGRGGSFDADALADAISDRFPTAAPSPTRRRLSGVVSGGWSDREVLVLGRGPCIETHQDAVNAYIQESDPIVLECNHIPFIRAGQTHVSAFIVLQNARSMVRAALSSGREALLGFSRASAGLEAELMDVADRVAFEPYHVSPGTLDVAGSPPVIPHDVVSMYLIALAIAQGATRIRVAGFDGYAENHDERSRRMQAEMDAFTALMAEHHPAVSIASLLPTTYDLPTVSIYGELFARGLDLEEGASGD